MSSCSWAFRFCRFSAFVPRLFSWWCSLLPGGGLPAALLVAFLLFPLFVFFAVWLLVFAVVRRLFFVRFPRPALGRWRWSFWRWSCVPSSSLPSLRASVPVWVVRPALVCRRSGAVLFFWVLVCPLEDDEEENFAAVAAGAAAPAAAAAAAGNNHIKEDRA